MDDGSTDGSTKKLKEWCAQHTNFRQSTLRKMQVKRLLWMLVLNMQQGNMWFSMDAEYAE